MSDFVVSNVCADGLPLLGQGISAYTEFSTDGSHNTNAWGNYNNQSGRSPKVVALFSATNFSSYIIELLQLHDTIQIKCNYAWIHYNIAVRSHLMI